jgi:hypothetical protein
MAFNGRFRKDNKTFHSFPPHDARLPVDRNPAYWRIGGELQLEQEFKLGVSRVNKASKRAE